MEENDQNISHREKDKIEPNKGDIYNALINDFPDVVLLLNRNGVILNASKNSSSYFNVENVEELIGRNLSDLATSGNKDKIKKDLSTLVASQSLGMVEYEFQGRSGTTFIGELSLSAFSPQRSNQEYFIAILRDITNQKIIEIELRENKQMFQLVMDNIPQLISWKDVNSIYLGCNKNFARVAGLNDPKEIIGKNDYELPWKISEAESFFEIDQLVMDTDKPEYHIIEPQLQADGKQAWLETNKIPLHNSKQEVVGILCTYEDITERVNSQNALRDSENKYKEAYNRAEFYKDVFAHDVSNILQGILSSVELSRFKMGKPKKNVELFNLFDIIEDQVSRGANLVSNIRKISSVDKINRNLRKIEICSILRNSNNYIKNNFPKRKIKITFKSDYDKLFVQANELIGDVFNNILYNAVKHNIRQIVEIEVEVLKKSLNEVSFVEVQFKDNGVGIRDSQKSDIFQISALESSSFNRLGLGLSLVKKLVENYNGRIWVEDRIKGDSTQGSKFILTLKEYLE
jgi:PAS domain S-box-containing protein